MTNEQQQLVLDIVSWLDYGAVTGTWPHQACHYCPGESSGYSDSQSFNHTDNCIVPLVGRLRETMWKRDGKE